MFFEASIISTVGPSFLTFGHLNIDFWRGLEASYVWCQEGNWGLNRPHDAHDAGSGGDAGRLKRAMNPNKMLKIHAVGSVCGCKYQ